MSPTWRPLSVGLLAAFWLSSALTAFAGAEDQRTYIQQWKDEAIRQMFEHRIPASITLAQGLLESGSGKSELSQKSNNHFGIKCHKDWQGGRTFVFFDVDDDGTRRVVRKSPSKVRTGEIPLKDVPYMQRGGSWTNSDLTGKKGWMNTGFGMYAFNDGKAKKAKANKFDAMYNPGSKRDGFSVGIFGEAGALDWTGRGARSGGGAEAGSKDGVTARAQKNGISADMQMWRDAGAVDPKKLQQNRWGRGGAPKIDVAKAKQPEKKFFGLF